MKKLVFCGSERGLSLAQKIISNGPKKRILNLMKKEVQNRLNGFKMCKVDAGSIYRHIRL